MTKAARVKCKTQTRDDNCHLSKALRRSTNAVNIHRNRHIYFHELSLSLLNGGINKHTEPSLSRACCVGPVLYPPIEQFLVYGRIIHVHQVPRSSPKKSAKHNKHKSAPTLHHPPSNPAHLSHPQTASRTAHDRSTDAPPPPTW